MAGGGRAAFGASAGAGACASRAEVGRQSSSRQETSMSSAFVESARNRARLVSGCGASGYKHLRAVYTVQEGGAVGGVRKAGATACMPSYSEL
jgi:hypothetical protein